MSYLYIDTSKDLIVGMLDKQFNWLGYERIPMSKGSTLIHEIIYNLSQKTNFDIAKPAAVFYAAGPGSYTGMRVASGIAGVYEWENIPVYSFYHYEVPSLLGVKEGVWYTEAFKQECFVYKWDEKNSQHELVKGELWKQTLNTHKNIYSQNEGSQGELGTTDLIFKQGTHFFQTILKLKLKKELYYFRPLEKEFTRAKV